MQIQKKNRIESIDLLRGIIMIIMALDHSREYFHAAAHIDGPLNLATTTPALYFTRYITHFCAPGFVFLSGMSAWMQHQRKSTGELSKFLITRGAWLIILDMVVITFGTTANPYFDFIIIQTLWAIGISMLILGLVIWLPFPLIFIIGLIIVFGHNLMDKVEAAQEQLPVWWNLMHKQAPVHLWGNHTLFIFYPFLPWTGLMMLGYCCGKMFTRYHGTKRNRKLLVLGLSILIFFVVLRYSNTYGDPQHWTMQKNAIYTIMSFLNVEKYPPSLLFLCITIGVSLIALAALANVRSRLATMIITYGRVPMFFYIIHFYILSGLNVLLFLLRGHTVKEGLTVNPNFPFKFLIPGEGYSLATCYLIWILVVICMYPLCRWYDRYRTSHPDKKWLSYF